MNNTINNTDSYIDTRDLQERRDELKESIFNDFIEQFPQYKEMTESYEDILFEEEEIQSWLEYWADEVSDIDNINHIENEVSEFIYGETLIHENYFVEYVEDLLTDCGYISKDMPSWIELDWEATADNVRVDYSSIEYLGETFYFRA